MNRKTIWFLSAGALLFIAATAPEPLRVPEGNGNPVLVDGQFSPGEWEDAAKIPVNDAITLFVKQYRGHVFLGVHCPSFRLKWCDLFICPDGKTINQLHVSAQLGERKLSTGGKEPDFRWGDTKDWYANEGRWDEQKLQELVKAGKNANEARAEVIYVSDGFEYQIKLDKFKSRQWRIRLSIGNYIHPDIKDYIFPLRTERNTTDGWLELVFGD